MVSPSRLGWRPRLDGVLCLCLGSRSGGVRGRIRDGRRGYGAHGRSQKRGGFPVNMDLGVLVGLQEGERRVAYLESRPPSLLLLTWGWGRRDGRPTDDGGDEERGIRDV